MSGLTLLDVSQTLDSTAPGEENAVVARYRTFDGLEVEIRAWKQNGRHHARLTAALNQPLAEAGIRSAQARAKADYEAGKNSDGGNAHPPLAVSDPAKDRQQRLDGLTAEAQKLQRRFTGWSFVIPADKYANMDKSLDDILKPSGTKPEGDSKPAVKKSPKH